MCDPVVAPAIAIGVASAGFSAMTAVGQHQNQQAAVARSNAIAQQQYAQQLQIMSAQEQAKGRAYEAQLNASNAAKNAYYKQISANQVEANRALTAAQNKLQEQQRSAAFQAQAQVAKSIQAQGQVLSTGRAGQSFLLQAMDAERQLGFEMAQIDATLYDARRASGLEQQGILLDQQSADMAAWNNLPADPLSPQAEFHPLAPVAAKGPSGLALAGQLGSAVMEGAETGYKWGKTFEGG